jgi:NTE family protein
MKIIPRLPEGTPDLFPLAGMIPIPGMRHLEALIATIIVGRDQTFLSQPCVEARTLQVDTSGTGVIDFDLSDAQKQQLRDNGWEAADQFLATWDWVHYLEHCRGTAPA